MTTIRGAITIENNEASEIISATATLLQEIIAKNNLQNSDIIAILFTATRDIDAAYPAVAARQMGLTDISLMCAQEMYVVDSLPMCIRVMVTVSPEENVPPKKQCEMIHCYMEKAAALRPDITAAPAKQEFYAVAIDGPCASGKSTIAKQVAKRLSINYVDTGAMYRAIALNCMRKGKVSAEEVSSELDNFQLMVKYEDGEQKIFVDGTDVTEAVRQEDVGNMASQIAQIPRVREKLLEFQRSLANGRSVIMDGRDIGSVVLPDAIAKFYVTASVDERAKRRCVELEQKGEKTVFEAIKTQIIKRDFEDSGREIAPLLVAEGAVELDTTDLTISEACDKIVEIINGKL